MRKNLKSTLMMLVRILISDSILPTSLTVPTLNETLAPSSSPPLPPTSAENGENQDDSNSNSDEE